MIPNKVDVKAMNGNTLRMIMSIESRPAAKNLLTTCPTPIPIRVMTPGLFSSCAAAISAFACSLVFGPSAAANSSSAVFAVEAFVSLVYDKLLSLTSDT